MPLDRSDIDAALTTKGFRKDQRSDHDRYWLFVGETKQAITTKMSRGTGHRTIGDNLVGLMARQVKLTGRQFREYVECTMSGSAYVACLRAQGVELAETIEQPTTGKKAKPPARKK
jgi:hypothetical protein